MGKSAWDTATRRVVWLDDGVEGLEGGLAGDRYRCQACGEHLMLKALVPTSDASPDPYFAHSGGARCSAPDREARIDNLTEVVIALRDTVCAVPGVTATLARPGEEPGHPTGLGPVIIACTAGATVAIERPPARLPGPEVLRRRCEAVREQHPGAAHVWFLKKDPAQFGKVGTLAVLIGREKDRHLTVAPTEQQEAIVAAGGHVYWLDGKQVLLPYGVHHFRHLAKPGQDWTNWTNWRSDPREDWRISQPTPAPDADYWGLATTALTSLTRTRAIFRPATAHQIMADLYTAQNQRHGWRNREAYKVHRERHQQPQTTPVPAAAPPAASPLPSAAPPAVAAAPPLPAEVVAATPPHMPDQAAPPQAQRLAPGGPASAREPEEPSAYFAGQVPQQAPAAGPDAPQDSVYVTGPDTDTDSTVLAPPPPPTAPPAPQSPALPAPLPEQVPRMIPPRPAYPPTAHLTPAENPAPQPDTPQERRRGAGATGRPAT